MSAEADEDRDEWLVSREDAAAFLGLTPHYLSELAQRPEFPHEKGEGYDLLAMNLAYIKYLRNLNKKGTSEEEEEEDGIDWRERKIKAQAEREEHDLAIARGEYITSEENIYEVEAIAGIIKGRLLEMPNKYAQAFALMDKPSEVANSLDDAIREIMDEIVARVDQLYAELEKRQSTQKELVSSSS